MRRVSIGTAFAIISTIVTYPALAQVTYKGDDALKLKCATMLMVVSRFDGGEETFSAETRLKAELVAMVLLAQLPGQENDKARAMQIMADRLVAQSSPAKLGAEFKRTLPVCQRFL